MKPVNTRVGWSNVPKYRLLALSVVESAVHDIQRSTTEEERRRAQEWFAPENSTFRFWAKVGEISNIDLIRQSLIERGLL